MMKPDLLMLMNSTWPASLWLQRLSPKTALRDCGPEIQHEADGKAFPVWRSKIGKFGRWRFGHNATQAIENAIRSAASMSRGGAGKHNQTRSILDETDSYRFDPD